MSGDEVPHPLIVVVVDDDQVVDRPVLGGQHPQRLGEQFRPAVGDHHGVHGGGVGGGHAGRGRNYIFSAPYTMVFPGLAITITVLAFNLLGDGIRDAFDPKSRKR